jgi:hypothetical protein
MLGDWMRVKKCDTFLIKIVFQWIRKHFLLNNFFQNFQSKKYESLIGGEFSIDYGEFYKKITVIKIQTYQWNSQIFSFIIKSLKPLKWKKFTRRTKSIN